MFGKGGSRSVSMLPFGKGSVEGAPEGEMVGAGEIDGGVHPHYRATEAHDGVPEGRVASHDSLVRGDVHRIVVPRGVMAATKETHFRTRCKVVRASVIHQYK